MIARLWWKEARIFWPLWVFVALIAVVGQWLALRYYGSDARNGVLGAMAIGWTCLYGFAVGAAAFAGEREGRTLLFLDTLAVSRIRLWGSKVSFAMATTLALAVVLVGIAALGTDRWETGQVGRGPIALAVGVLLLEVVAWGLFWSAVSGTALTAATLAVCSMGAVGLFVQGGTWFYADDLASNAATHLALALAAAGASAVILTWNGPRRPTEWGRSSRLPRRTGPRRSARRRISLIRGLTRSDDRDQVRAPSPRPTATAAAWSLAWMTVREAYPFWWRIVALNLGLIVLSSLRVHELQGWSAFLLAFNLAIALIAGVNVFGTESRARTHRFLAHHGVSPGWAWAVKTAVWAGALFPVWGILAAGAWFMGLLRGVHNRQGALFALVYAAALMNSFVIGQLCGMAIRRGITAALVATVALIAVMVPLGGLLGLEMLPSWGLVLISPALLVVGWAWSRDWLLDRPGPGRLVRLSLLLATALGVLFVGYIAYRVESVPDLRPALVKPLAVSVPAPDASPKPNSADLYREATLRLTPAPPAALVLVGDPNSDAIRGIGMFEAPTTNPAGVWLRENAEVLALVRRATDALAGPVEGQADDAETLALLRRVMVLPRSPMVPIESLTLFSRPESIPYRGLTLLVAVSCRERRERGDLAGAWEDIAVLLRMARYLNGPVPLKIAFEGLNTEQQALGLAMNWAVDSRQTSERLRASLADFRWLQVPFRDASDSIRIEARIAEQTLNLPRAQLAGWLLARISEPRPADSTLAAWSELVTTPWEVTRARRAFPLLFAAKVETAEAEPFQRVLPGYLSNGWGGFHRAGNSSFSALSGDDLSHFQGSTPLVQQLFPPVDLLIEANNRNEVARRALIQILALRSWQIQHGGRLPDRLSELVPSELDPLPRDPYAGNAFGYISSEGHPLLPLGRFEPLQAGFRQSELIPTAGHRLLYSFGPNRQNDHARANLTYSSSSTDIIFPLPESVPRKDADARPSR